MENTKQVNTNYLSIFLCVFILLFNSCDHPQCCKENEFTCKVASLKKLYELPTSNGEQRYTSHYILIPNYKRCCGGKIDYLDLAKVYRDTASNIYPISDIIFIKTIKGFYNNDMMPDDNNLIKTGLVHISYNLDNIEDLKGDGNNCQVSFFSY